MDGLLQDFRLAWRGIRAKPGFSAVVIVTLALGIGVNTAVFSLANWVMLRPVPGVKDGGRLVTVQIRDHRGGEGGTSHLNLLDLRANVPGFAGLAGFNPSNGIPVRVGDGKPSIENTEFVSSEYLATLGVSLERGLSFSPAEERDALADPTVVISHAFWAERLGQDPDVVGRRISIGGRSTRIVGVTAPEFHGAYLLNSINLWMPATSEWRPGTIQNRGASMYISIAGRLAPGVTTIQAQNELRMEIARLVAAFPENRRWYADGSLVVKGVGMQPNVRDDVSRTFAIIGAIALLVLVVACANVANLYLLRGVATRGAVAVRRALGASTARVARGELLASLSAAVLGGIAALGIAVPALRLFHGRILPPLPFDISARIDWRVFAFALGAAVVTGLAAGAIPAAVAARTDIVGALKEGSRAHSRERPIVRHVLVTTQLAVSLAVLVATILLAITVRNLERVDVGFDADRVVAVSVAPSLTGHRGDEGGRLMRAVLEQLQATGSVESAAFADRPPFSWSLGDHVRAADVPGDSGISVSTVQVTPEYFRTLGIRLLRGRTFRDDEEFTDSPAGRVVILSRAAAERLFRGADPLGRMVVGALGIRSVVVGVVTDSRWNSLEDDGAGPIEYGTIGTAPSGAAVARTLLPAAQVQHRVEEIMARLAPDVPVGSAERLSDAVRRSFADETLMARLMTLFASLAVTLAGVGVYGVVAFMVAERTREIGIRMALGAQAAHILGMVLRRGALLGGAGLVAGIGGAVALSRVVASQLYGVRPLEPMIYVLTTVLLLLVVLGASLIPARRATQVDPATTLRSE